MVNSGSRYSGRVTLCQSTTSRAELQRGGGELWHHLEHAAPDRALSSSSPMYWLPALSR